LKTGHAALHNVIFGEKPGHPVRASIIEEGRTVPLEEAINDALEKLPLKKGRNDPAPWRRPARTLELAFDLKKDAKTTDQLIAGVLGVTKGRAFQLRHQALRMMRHPTRARRLRQFCTEP